MMKFNRFHEVVMLAIKRQLGRILKIVTLSLMAACPASAGSVAALDAKNGFQFLSLGTPISEIGKCKFPAALPKFQGESVTESVFQVGDFIVPGLSLVESDIMLDPEFQDTRNGAAMEPHKNRCLASMQALGVGSAGWLPSLSNVGDTELLRRFRVVASGGKIVAIKVSTGSSSDLTKAMNTAYGIPQVEGSGRGLLNANDGYCVGCTYRWRGRNVVATAESFAREARDYDQTGKINRESWTIEISLRSYVDALADQKTKEEQRKLQQAVDGL